MIPKRMSVLLTVIFFAAGAAEAVNYRGVQNVQKTPHNLSSGTAQMYKADNEDEVCIFCHTPHGGDMTGQLWNRNMTDLKTKVYTHYNSATLSSALKTSRPAGGLVHNESLLCLSCHDGSVAVGQIMNFSNETGAVPDNNDYYIPSMFGTPGPKIGDAPLVPGVSVKEVDNDLSDDHPISFSYDQVKNFYDANSRSGELKTTDIAKANGVRFFGSSNRVECSSCHDPHVDYGDVWTSDNWNDPSYTKYKPFLIRDNAGSALCLACHTK